MLLTDLFHSICPRNLLEKMVALNHSPVGKTCDCMNKRQPV